MSEDTSRVTRSCSSNEFEEHLCGRGYVGTGYEASCRSEGLSSSKHSYATDSVVGLRKFESKEFTYLIQNCTEVLVSVGDWASRIVAVHVDREAVTCHPVFFQDERLAEARSEPVVRFQETPREVDGC